MNIYIYENRKKKWKKGKRKRNSELTGLGGIFGPASAGERAATWAGGPLGPPQGETARGWRGDSVVAWAHVPKKGEADGVERATGRARPPVRPRGGSSSGSRFCNGKRVARHGRG
jgi:hypothetical protein